MSIYNFKRYLLGQMAENRYLIDGPFFLQFNINNEQTVEDLVAIAKIEGLSELALDQDDEDQIYLIDEETGSLTVNVFTNVDEFSLVLKHESNIIKVHGL